MQYMMLIYENEEIFGGPDKTGPIMADLGPRHFAFSHELGEQMRAGAGLKGTEAATTVRTTAGKQTLVIDKKDLDYMNGKRILVVDDVISTGGSLHALDALAARSSGTIVAQAAVLAEGDAAERKDIIFLEPLPLFAH